MTRDITKFMALILVVSSLLMNVQATEPANDTVNQTLDNQEEIQYHYFYMDGCPNCEKQEEFHETLFEKYPQLEVHKYDIYASGSVDKAEEFAEEYGEELGDIRVPMTFVAGEFYKGFNSNIQDEIEKTVRGALGEPVDDEENITEEEGQIVDLPFFGETDLTKFSLPVLAAVLGTADGFNVCSIGALLLILGIVLKLEDRKKILFYGGLFILTTVSVYGVIVFAWYGIINAVIGYFGFLELFIGLVALAGGIYFFREFLQFYKYGPTCETTGSKYVSKVRRKVTKTLRNPKAGIWATAGIVFLFAIVMVVVELPCSIGLPLVFTGVLADAGLATMGSGMYILLYLFFYMFIELVIFLGAVISKEMWFDQENAVTWTTLAASLIMFFLAYYYLQHVIPFL